jgi:hypothetical protein
MTLKEWIEEEELTLISTELLKTSNIIYRNIAQGFRCDIIDIDCLEQDLDTCEMMIRTIRKSIAKKSL